MAFAHLSYMEKHVPVKHMYKVIEHIYNTTFATLHNHTMDEKIHIIPFSVNYTHLHLSAVVGCCSFPDKHYV